MEEVALLIAWVGIFSIMPSSPERTGLGWQVGRGLLSFVLAYIIVTILENIGWLPSGFKLGRVV